MPDRSLIATTSTSSKAVISVTLGLVLLTALVYSPVVNFEFVDYDDDLCVTENPHVLAGLTLDGFRWAWTTTHHANWHPLTWLSYMIDAELSGRRASGYHATNLVLHLAAVAILLSTLWRMTGQLWPSLLVAALYALHPLHVQSVAWIGERKGMLANLFWIAAMWAYAWYVARPTLGRYAVVFLAFVAGLLSKQLAITLPLALLLFDYWPLRRCGVKPSHGERPVHWRQLVVEKLPLLAIAALFCVVAYVAQAQGGALRSAQAYSLEVRLANVFISYMAYLRQMIWPADLAVFYPHPGRLPHGWQLLPAVGGFVAISFFSLYAARRWPFVFVGWWFYVGVLMPMIGLVQIADHQKADRYTDIPLIGIYLMLAWGALTLAQTRPWVKPWMARAAAATVVACSIASFCELQYWRGSEPLFQRALAVTKSNYVAHNNLGAVYARRRERELAIAEFRAALAAKPDYVTSRRNLAREYARTDRASEAEAEYRTLARSPSARHEDLHNLGTVLMNQGKFADAAQAYRSALAIEHGMATTHFSLGNALAELGERENAIRCYREALRIDPQHARAKRALEEQLNPP